MWLVRLYIWEIWKYGYGLTIHRPFWQHYHFNHWLFPAVIQLISLRVNKKIKKTFLYTYLSHTFWFRNRYKYKYLERKHQKVWARGQVVLVPDSISDWDLIPVIVSTECVIQLCIPFSSNLIHSSSIFPSFPPPRHLPPQLLHCLFY